MKIEILYFDGCPTYRVAEEVLREVFAEEGTNAEVELVAANTDEEAQQLRFPGSPMIRVDGEDLFPVPERGLGVGVSNVSDPRGAEDLADASDAQRGAGHQGIYPC